MLTAVLALIVLLQSQTPTPGAQATASPAPPVAAPATPPPASSEEAAAPEPQSEPVAEEPRTRQVCRFVELPGRRFPVRRCHTVEIQD